MLSNSTHSMLDLTPARHCARARAHIAGNEARRLKQQAGGLLLQSAGLGGLFPQAGGLLLQSEGNEARRLFHQANGLLEQAADARRRYFRELATVDALGGELDSPFARLG